MPKRKTTTGTTKVDDSTSQCKNERVDLILTNEHFGDILWSGCILKVIEYYLWIHQQK